METKQMDVLGTSDLAKQGGVNPETIRYYERRGLLPKPPRTPAGYRAFDADAVRRLRFVKQAQALGFSLKEVGELLALRREPRTPCADVRRRAARKIADIDAKVRALRAMKNALGKIVAACSGRGPISACPILDALDGHEPDTSLPPTPQRKGGERR